MQRWAIAVLVVLCGCASDPPGLRGGQPSLATAQAALSGGAPDLALRVCDGLLTSFGANADVFVCQGDALTALGRGAEAEGRFNQALRIERSSTGALTGLGRLSLQTRPADAEALFLRVLEQRPRNAVALNNLGIARDLQGRHAAAQTAYGEAIAAAPDMRAAQINLALSMALSGRSEEAIRLARPIATAPGATVQERHVLAAVLGMAGQPAEATRLLQPDLPMPQVDEALEGYRALPSR
ncbi:MAG: tetratricopeptide repeat protein [Gemmatimonadaceae bacterium]|nr:tetratricopeptide repeat protein [Acetobacteraceae bacterium]